MAGEEKLPAQFGLLVFPHIFVFDVRRIPMTDGLWTAVSAACPSCACVMRVGNRLMVHGTPMGIHEVLLSIKSQRASWTPRCVLMHTVSPSR
jgi:hypothetical protein